jgi:hypothetical protein
VSTPIRRFDRATTLAGSLTLKPVLRLAMPPQAGLQSTRVSAFPLLVFVAGVCFGMDATAPCAYFAKPQRAVFVPRRLIPLTPIVP